MIENSPDSLLASSCLFLGFRWALLTNNRLAGEPHEFPPKIRLKEAPVNESWRPASSH
jgi:hypothetical protein